MSYSIISYHSLIDEEFRKFFDNRKILITGASGLLGSHFAGLFQEFNKDFSGNISLTLISKTGVYPFDFFQNTRSIKCDLESSDLSEDLEKQDIIIHCAGYGQPTKFQQHQLKTIHLNTSTSLQLTKLLEPNGSFLFLSSSEVYSGLNNPPFTEDRIGATNTDHPRSAYIESKRTGEAIVSALRRSRSDISAYSARLALAYGPGFKKGDGRVLNELIVRGIIEGSISLRDSGNSMRTYCYIFDAIRQCISILISGHHEIYNVGGLSRISIAELATMVARLLEVPLHIPLDQDNFLSDAPTDVWLDLSRIEAISGVSNYIDINRGLEDTIAWARKIYEKD